MVRETVRGGATAVAQIPDEPGKIIIDEDWKSRVAAEKEALRRQQQAAPPVEPIAAGEGPAAGPAESARPNPEPAEGAGGFPPASLPVLLTTLATEAMVHLGQIPHPATDQPQVDLGAARHFIDTLAMLEAKTAGNRTPDESRLLDGLLHDLRMAFIAVRDRLPIANPPTG